MMRYDEPILTDGGGVKTFDIALTQAEWREGAERDGIEPLPELSEEQKAEILAKDQIAKKRAAMQLIMSHPTEFERRLQKIRKELGIDKHLRSTWLDAIQDLQQENR